MSYIIKPSSGKYSQTMRIIMLFYENSYGAFILRK